MSSYGGAGLLIKLPALAIEVICYDSCAAFVNKLEFYRAAIERAAFNLNFPKPQGPASDVHPVGGRKSLGQGTVTVKLFYGLKGTTM